MQTGQWQGTHRVPALPGASGIRFQCPFFSYSHRKERACFPSALPPCLYFQEYSIPWGLLVCSLQLEWGYPRTSEASDLISVKLRAVVSGKQVNRPGDQRRDRALSRAGRGGWRQTEELTACHSAKMAAQKSQGNGPVVRSGQARGEVDYRYVCRGRDLIWRNEEYVHKIGKFFFKIIYF